MNLRQLVNDLPIKRKLAYVTLVTCLGALTLASAVLFWFQTVNFRRSFAAELESLGAIIASNSAAPLAFDDRMSAMEMLNVLQNKSVVTSAFIYDSQGNLFASLGEPPRDQEYRRIQELGVVFDRGYARLSLPVNLDDTRSGHIYLRARFADRYQDLLTLYAAVVAAVVAGSLVVIFLMSSLLQTLITRPVNALAAVAQNVSEHEDYSARAVEYGRDEIGLLTRTFNRMLDQIQSRDRRLHESQQELVDASRLAGMAEVATGVLHNVGNVLNSVNVSANLVVEQIRKSKTGSLAKAVELIKSQRHDLGTFLATDPRGRQLPDFLEAVSTQLLREQALLSRETEALQKNIEHSKQIVAMQQSYAKVAGAREPIQVQELVEDALRMASASLVRHQVTIVREFEPAPPVLVDRHLVLQILVNLITNAKQALDHRAEGRKLVLRVSCLTGSRVRLEVTDNGVGIPKENVARIFNHGFTTKQTGHGFGLHSGANAAHEMGGSLFALSDGPGTGATFVLELPTEQVREELKTFQSARPFAAPLPALPV
jgi:two-component system, NtrC family, sensor kinase